MRTAALIAIVLAAEPASAHCFRIWHYLTPQRCHMMVARLSDRPQGVSAAGAQVDAPPMPAPPPERPKPKPEQPKPALADPDEAARTNAIERLKMELYIWSERKK